MSFCIRLINQLEHKRANELIRIKWAKLIDPRPKIDLSHLSPQRGLYKLSWSWGLDTLIHYCLSKSGRENLRLRPSREQFTLLHCQDPRKSHRLEVSKSLRLFFINWKTNLRTSKFEVWLLIVSHCRISFKRHINFCCI